MIGQLGGLGDRRLAGAHTLDILVDAQHIGVAAREGMAMGASASGQVVGVEPVGQVVVAGVSQEWRMKS